MQPHCGANANMAAYLALINPGDKILGLSLEQGGHLTHGLPVNFSGRLFEAHFYGVDPETGIDRLRWLLVRRRKCVHAPSSPVAAPIAASIDFARFREIADEVDAYLFADIAHPAGLVAAGLHPNPIPYAHVTMTTTHKTLRGPRGGMILTSEEFGKAIDKTDLSGLAGRSADACHRRQSGGFWRGAAAVVQDLFAASDRERSGDGRGARTARIC